MINVHVHCMYCNKLNMHGFVWFDALAFFVSLVCNKLYVNVNTICMLFAWIILFYYINTNEIPGELSRENLISSHVKITCYLHMWKYHLCYGYVINRAFHTKKLLSEMVWYFIGVYIINRTLHGHLEIRNFSSCVDKIFHSFAAHSWNIFQHEKRNFVSLCGHVIISSMYLPVLDAMQLLQGENYYSWNIHIRSIGKV